MSVVYFSLDLDHSVIRTSTIWMSSQSIWRYIKFKTKNSVTVVRLNLCCPKLNGAKSILKMSVSASNWCILACTHTFYFFRVIFIFARRYVPGLSNALSRCLITHEPKSSEKLDVFEDVIKKSTTSEFLFLFLM